MFAFGCWAGIKMFLHEKGACQNDMKTVSLQFYSFTQWTGTERFVLLNGPVPECLRLVPCKELPLPKDWNSRLPTWEPQVTILQVTAGSKRLELLVPNLGTVGYHCKQLPVTRGWNSSFPTWEP